MLFSEEKYDELSSQEITEKQDVSREGLTWVKVSHFVKVLFSQKAKNVLETHDKFSNIYFDDLRIYWKDWIILDVDDCIAPHHWDILPENLRIIEKLVYEGWKIVVFSNMKYSDKCKELEDLWIEIVTSQYAKPDTRGFEECVEVITEFFEEKNTWKKFNRDTFQQMDYDCDEMECDLFENFSEEERSKIIKKQIVMIWDNRLTDWWAIFAWIDFVKVKPIEPEKWEVQSAARKFQVAVRLIVDNIIDGSAKTTFDKKWQETYNVDWEEYIKID